jgi:hypothetical protein
LQQYFVHARRDQSGALKLPLAIGERQGPPHDRPSKYGGLGFLV